MKRKISVLALALTLIFVFQSISYGIDTTVIDERWGKPTFVFGESLTDDQINKTGDLLNIEDPINVNYVKVTYMDLVNYIGGDPNNPANMISSVLVKKENEGRGIQVHILTPENITQISEENYANAAITAGVKDASIEVAAIRKVTGESALTGVYKAFEANGEALDKERMEVAQEELIVVNGIEQENKDKEGFESKDLNQVIIEIKNHLSDININSNNRQISRDEIVQVVQDTIKDYRLEDFFSEDQINRLVSYFEKYVNTEAINSAEVRAQLEELSSSIKAGAKEIYRQAEEAGLIESVGNFFQSLLEKIIDLFTK